MKRFFRILLLSCIILIAPLTLAQNIGSEEAKAFKSITDFSKTITSIESDFLERKKMSMLQNEVVRAGKLYFVAPSEFRWEYDVRNYGVSSSSKSYMIINGAQNDMASRAFAQVAKVVTSFMVGAPINERDYDYSIELKGNSLELTLLPKNRRIKSVIDSIVISFNQKNKEIEWYRMEQKNNITTVEFKNIRYNKKLDKQLFN